MLSRISPRLPTDDLVISEVENADVRQEVRELRQALRATNKRVRDLVRALTEHWQLLGKPGALTITQAVISDCTISGLVTSGTWTPVIVGDATAGVQTYNAQVGYYTKIDTLVFLHRCRVSLTAKGGTMAGNAVIKGLPFSPAATATLRGAITVGLHNLIDLTAGYTEVGLIEDDANDGLALMESGDNVAAQRIVAAGITNNTAVDFAGVYSTE